MIIRSMNENDLETVLNIETASFISPWTHQHFIYELNENPFSFLYVLEDNEELIGYIGFWVMFEQAQITKIAIRKEDRKYGLATQLMDFAMKRIKQEQCESITLEVRKSNVAAQKLYEKLGFEYCGVRKNYYDNEDGILMGVGI